MTDTDKKELLTLLREIREAVQSISGETFVDDAVVASVFFAANDAIKLVEAAQ